MLTSYLNQLSACDRYNIDPSDILPRHIYAKCRSKWLPLMREYLGNRRVRVGENITILFENSITVRHQIQEILYWETRNDADANLRTHEELDLYRSLIPSRYRLTATLLVDGGTRESGLSFGEALTKQQPCIGLSIGNYQVPAQLADGDPDPAEPVKYLYFDLSREQRRALTSGTPISVWVLEDGKRLIKLLPASTIKHLVEDFKDVTPLELAEEKRNSNRTDWPEQKAVASAASC